MPTRVGLLTAMMEFSLHHILRDRIGRLGVVSSGVCVPAARHDALRQRNVHLQLSILGISNCQFSFTPCWFMTSIMHIPCSSDLFPVCPGSLWHWSFRLAGEVGPSRNDFLLYGKIFIVRITNCLGQLSGATRASSFPSPPFSKPDGKWNLGCCASEETQQRSLIACLNSSITNDINVI